MSQVVARGGDGPAGSVRWTSAVAATAPLGSSMVVLHHVSKAYHRDAEPAVLEDCSLTIDAGAFAAVLGVSGSGKTTLLNLIGGLDAADSGKIIVAGQALTGATRAELTAFRRRSVGFVFQFYNLLPTLTAVENVELGIELLGLGARETRKRALTYLDLVGLSALAARFPSQLSGGQQQRVAIARALAKKPAVLLADEPTGNLDVAAADEVVEQLQALQRQIGTTVVMATHNHRIAGIADVAMHIVGGHVQTMSVDRQGATSASTDLLEPRSQRTER
jgi:putative ABC transport system ATP-binding protein